LPQLCASGDLQVPLSEQSDRGGRPTGTRMRTAAGRPTKHAPRPRPLPSNPFPTRDSVLIRSHMLRKALIDFESGFRNQKNEYSRKRFRHCHFCLPSATYNRRWVPQPCGELQNEPPIVHKIQRVEENDPPATATPRMNDTLRSQARASAKAFAAAAGSRGSATMSRRIRPQA